MNNCVVNGEDGSNATKLKIYVLNNVDISSKKQIVNHGSKEKVVIEGDPSSIMKKNQFLMTKFC